MTDDMMNMRARVEEIPDTDLLREIIGLAAENLMEMGVGAATPPPSAISRRSGRPSETASGTVIGRREPAPSSRASRS